MADQEKWRLVFKKDNKLYKMCAFWGWDKDATLNFLIYSNDKILRKVNQVSETKTINPDGTNTISQKIAFEDVVPTDFEANKHTFHPSGYIHTTNKRGERYESGIKSIPFEKIADSHLLTLIVPKNPTAYPQISERELGKNDVVLDTAIFQNSPFQISVFIVRGENEPPVNTQIAISANVVCGESEEYRLIVRCEQPFETVGNPFPPFTLIGTPVTTS